MAEEKRIYELTLETDTQGKVIMIDEDGNTEASHTSLVYHVVSTLPLSPTNGWIYHLTADDGLAPIGVYTYKDGWECVTQNEVMQLSDWSGGVTVELISGVSYAVSVTGDVTSLEVLLNTSGTCRLVMENPSLFEVSQPVGAYYTTRGFTALGDANVRISIQRDSAYYEWCTSDRIEIPVPFLTSWSFPAETAITLPLNSDDGYVYDFTIDWGDGSTDTITDPTQTEATHTYAAGDYSMSILGTCPAWDFYDYGDGASYLTNVIQLGIVGWLDLEEAFSGCDSLLTFRSGVCDTSNVIDMNYMFESCWSMVECDLSTMDTSLVTDMNDMFYDCSTITSIDVSGFDTSQVADMSYMFAECLALESIDVSNFDYSSVTSVNAMFEYTESLQTADFSNFIAPLITGTIITYVFDGSGLKDLTMQNFHLPNRDDGLEDLFTNSVFETVDISNSIVGDQSLSYMFAYCESLTALNMTGVDTSAVEDMSYMLQGCELLDFDIRTLDMSSAIDISGIISDRESVTSLDLSGLNAPNVTTANSVLSGWDSLTTLNMTGWNAPNITSMYQFFANCGSMVSIDLSDFGNISLLSASAVFTGCSSLTSIDFGTIDWSSNTQMGSFVEGCTSLVDIDLTVIDMGSADYVRNFFAGCTSLVTVDMTPFTAQLTSIGDMFNGCTALTHVDLSTFDVSINTGTHRMFEGCTALTDVDVTGWDIGATIWMTDMFKGCTLDTQNYSDILEVFGSQTTLANVIFDGGSSGYFTSAVPFRDALTGNGWTITDGGEIGEG